MAEQAIPAPTAPEAPPLVAAKPSETAEPARVEAATAPAEPVAAPAPQTAAAPATVPAPATGAPPAQVAAEAPSVPAEAPKIEAAQAAATPDAAAAPEAPQPVEAPVAEAPAPAPDAAAPATLPALALNPPRLALVRMKAPVLALDAASVQTGAAPGLLPQLAALAPAAEPHPAAVAGEATTQQTPAAVATQGGPTAAEPAAAGDSGIEALLAQGVAGPARIRLADRATMWLPSGRVFLPLEPARKLAAEVGLDLRPGVQGIVTGAGGGLDWLAPIELIDDGHIGAGAPDQLDAGKLLSAFNASLPQVNAQRGVIGQPKILLGEWMAPPVLDGKHRLPACVTVATAEAAGAPDHFFNCEAWALGRDGAIKASVADGSEQAARLKEEARAIVGTIAYDHGRAFEDFDPASDRVAPYAVSDLLIHDVSSAAAPAASPTPAAPPAPPAEAAAPDAVSEVSIVDRLTEPLNLALLGGAMALLWLREKRRRKVPSPAAKAAQPAGQPAPAVTKPAPKPEAAAAKKAPVVAPKAAGPSLFARLLPTLHALLTKKKDAPVAAPSAPKATAPASLFARLLPTVHARFARKTATRAASQAEDAAAPASALRNVAARMKGAAEAPAPAVTVARAARPVVRTVGNAALALDEDEEAMESAASGSAVAGRSASSADDLGLVEPGDAEAATAAINAARALRGESD
ncbi:MAG: DUF2167 domain-containing protein [Methylocystis sp.]|uniref:DUF2167 domain-containing protein n=1 Tax=Methylocystis sp. TaxID=1911079 RepID=UPI003DA307E5